MPLTPHLQKACVRVLIHCRECKDRLTLEPLFGIVPLTKYPDALPLQARSQVDLIESLINNLVTYSGKRGEPLLDLLVVLRDKREEVEDEWKTLDELFKQVSFYLSSLAGESDESAGERRPSKSETQELRKAVDLYTEKPNQDHNSETAANWIGQSYNNHEEWAIKIALTVFNGGPWDMCMEASVDLASRLAKASDSKIPLSPNLDLSGTPPPSPLKILEQAGGVLVTENTRRIVRLKNSQMSREALDYVWDEYTRRGLLIEWLSELVVSPNSHKRIRGAIAAGFLMLNNFEGIQRSLLLRWAHADDARSYRQAIGRALSVVAEEGSRLTEVRKLLEFWTRSPDKELRWAAARAYIYVGLRCSVKEVIKHWRIIAEAEDFSSATINFGNIQWVLVNPLHLSLLDAMERLFLNALEVPEIRQTAFAEGVESFKQWSDDEQPLDDTTAEDDGPKSLTVGFGLMMLIKLSQMNLPTEDDSSDWPPMLLTLMEPDKTDSVCRKCLVEVFEQLLLDPASQPTALEILREWLNRVERSKRLEAEFRCFIDELLSRAPLQGEILRRVAMHLDLWSPHSRFRLCPPHPDLNGLKDVVLVVDGSESALRYWSEIRSLALELGSALSGTVTPEIYLLNTGEVKDLMALADTKLDWDHEEKPNCSLIAPAMRDLISRRQHSDALILIGNGEVFDLEDWLGHPSVDRWIFVRLGPDGILPERLKNRDEITEDSSIAVYERLLNPIQNKKPYSNGVRATSTASDRWKLDRTGYPMVRIDPLQRYVQLFPVAKVQFEQFISDRSHSSWTDEDYAEALALNPRVSFRETSCTRFEQLFLTGIRPSETTDFVRWLGDEYSLPNDRQWLTSYNWLAAQAITEPPPGISEDALAIWRIIVAVRRPQTLLDLSLMSEGIREWVTVGSDVDRFSALGSPVHRFPTLSRDPRTLVKLTTVEPRLNAYGFRLLRS